MNTGAIRKTVSLLMVGTTIGLAPAYAQDVSHQERASSSAGGSDIVVTARKREETVLDVPISVSAFSSQRIEDRLVQDITDLAEFTPGLQIQESFGRSFDRPIIRGASNVLQAEGKVGIFIDGVPYFGDFSSLDLANAERVEVIKGPQSAVFGRGTLAGAINVVMKRPGQEFEGKVSATFGNYNKREFSLSVSTPVTSWLGVQASAKVFDIDGQFANQAVFGERLGDQNTHQFTAGVFIDPSTDVRASVRWIHQRDNDGHFAIALQPSSKNNCFLSTRPYYCGKVERPTSFGINTDVMQRPGLYRNADRFIGDFAWDIAGSGYEFSFQAGYSDLIEVVGVDQTYDARSFWLLGAPPACNFIPIQNRLCSQSSFHSTTGTHRKTETYEARITSPAGDRLRWRIGAFSSTDRSHALKQYLEASEVGPDILVDGSRIQNTAFFGGVDFDVNDALTVGVELRHQIDKVRAITPSYRVGDVFSPAYLALLRTPNPNQIIGVAGVRNAKFKATLPRITANYKVSPDLSFYAQYSKGNSPGGFNPLQAPETTFDEETLTNYEVGVKTTKFGFNYLNIAAFWQDYGDQVLTNTYRTQTTINSYKANIGKTRIRGLEFEGSYPLFDRAVTLQFNYTFLDAKIRQGVEADQALILMGTACKTGSATNLDLPGCRDAASIAGNRPPLVSKHTGSIGLRTSHEIGGGLTLFTGTDLIYRSSFSDVLNLAHTGHMTKVNAQIGIHDENGLRITFYGRNLFNDKTPMGILRYVDLAAGVAKAPTGDSARAFAITPARKPEYGLTVTKNF